MATRHNLDSEDDGTSTQPVTSCCSEQEQNDNKQLEEPIQIHAAYDKVNITWTDGSGQAQSIDDIYLKADIDTLVSKAIFRLTCRVLVKGKGKNRPNGSDRQSVYIFIHPENIQTIRLEVKDDVSLLHFSMDRDHSRLVVPNDRVLECKHSTLPRMHLLKMLATTDMFTMHFKDSDTNLLPQIGSIFSYANFKHIETDNRRVDLQSLYSGIGGHVFDASTIPVGANIERDQALSEDTSGPPPLDYEPTRESKPLRKRKRERERERESSDADYDRPPMHHSKGLIEHLLDMENRLRNDMKVMTESSEKRLRDDVKNMIESTEHRVKDMIESAEDQLRNHVKDVVEATASRLKDEMNDMLDSRADDIDGRIDGSVDDLRTECIGTIESEFGYLKYGIEEVTNGLDEAEEKMKGVLSLLDEAGDGIERRVGRYLNSIRLQVTVEDE